MWLGDLWDHPRQTADPVQVRCLLWTTEVLSWVSPLSPKSCVNRQSPKLVFPQPPVHLRPFGLCTPATSVSWTFYFDKTIDRCPQHQTLSDPVPVYQQFYQGRNSKIILMNKKTPTTFLHKRQTQTIMLGLDTGKVKHGKGDTVCRYLQSWGLCLTWKAGTALKGIYIRLVSLRITSCGHSDSSLHWNLFMQKRKKKTVQNN